MAKTNPRKTLDEVLESTEFELNPSHVSDWHYGYSPEQFLTIKKEVPKERFGKFNIEAAITNPKSIRFRQMASQFDYGKAGDYLFLDMGGGMMGIPYKLFKRLF